MINKLIEKIQKTHAPIVVGLDPMLNYVPEHIQKRAFAEYGETLEGAAEAIWQFNKEIVDATYDLIPAVKPQVAMYEQFGIEGVKAFKKTVDYCHEKGLVVIGDVKRGDIGSTSEAYAVGHLGKVKVGSQQFAGFDEDFATVNPYLGSDGIKPFIKVCKEENKGLFNKLFGNMKKQLEKILDKYHTMGEEVDKIYVQLREYEGEIKQSNRKLEQMFDANVDYYHQLVKYILAGEQGCRELEAYIAQRQADFEATGDNSIQLELAGLNNALMMLEQRTQDLRVAENIAIQSIPMIKTMAYSNMNLVRKINSAFIVTLPVFKQGLAQAVMLKRQKIQAEALSELDKKTNEMLIKNAKNTVEQSKMTARLASGSSVKIETLETTWRTIVNGIEETQNIQKEARKQRIDDAARLENIKQEFLKTYGGAGK